MALPILVINTDSRPDRLRSVAAQLVAQGLGWQRIAAASAMAAGAEAALLRGRFGGGPVALRHPATLGDVCCSLAHQEAWPALLAADAPAALVLEDDAILAPGLAGWLGPGIPALMARHGMGVVKLEHWPGPQAGRRRPLGRPLCEVPGQGRAVLYRLRSSFYGSCAYLVTAEAARAFLARYPEMRVPVDHFLFSRAAALGYRLGRPGFVDPAPVRHGLAEFGSDIAPARAALPVPHPARRRTERWSRLAQALEARLGRARRVDIRFAGPAEDAPRAGG